MGHSGHVGQVTSGFVVHSGEVGHSGHVGKVEISGDGGQIVCVGHVGHVGHGLQVMLVYSGQVGQVTSAFVVHSG